MLAAGMPRVTYVGRCLSPSIVQIYNQRFSVSVILPRRGLGTTREGQTVTTPINASYVRHPLASSPALASFPSRPALARRSPGAPSASSLVSSRSNVC